MYMGGFLGYVRQENSVGAASSRLDFSSRFDGGSAADFGGTLGGRLGYNLQVGEAILGMSLEINSLFGESVNTNMGEYYDAAHGDVLSVSESYSISSTVDGLVSFPISLGFVTQGNNLVYMRGGYALASIEVQNEVFPEENRGSQVVGGYNVGLGFSKFATENISVYMEGNYYRFDEIENRLSGEDFNSSTSVRQSLLSLIVGINIHF